MNPDEPAEDRAEDPGLSALLRNATRHAAGADLRAAVRTQVALANAQRSPARVPRRWPRPTWPGVAAGFAAGVAAALVGVFVAVPALRPGHGGSLEAELVADHVRALHVGPLAEVASNDRHNVKPWFQGRLDYAPPVPDLGAQGYALLGGRVEHVQGRAVAALAYVYRRHVIDVFVWPADGARPTTLAVQRGFSVAHWSDGAMQAWAVTDADRAEAERFAAAWQQALR